MKPRLVSSSHLKAAVWMAVCKESGDNAWHFLWAECPACLPGIGPCQEETVDLGAEGKAESGARRTQSLVPDSSEVQPRVHSLARTHRWVSARGRR